MHTTLAGLLLGAVGVLAQGTSVGNPLNSFISAVDSLANSIDPPSSSSSSSASLTSSSASTSSSSHSTASSTSHSSPAGKAASASAAATSAAPAAPGGLDERDKIILIVCVVVGVLLLALLVLLACLCLRRRRRRRNEGRLEKAHHGDWEKYGVEHHGYHGPGAGLLGHRHRRARDREREGEAQRDGFGNATGPVGNDAHHLHDGHHDAHYNGNHVGSAAMAGAAAGGSAAAVSRHSGASNVGLLGAARDHEHSAYRDSGGSGAFDHRASGNSAFDHRGSGASGMYDHRASGASGVAGAAADPPRYSTGSGPHHSAAGPLDPPHYSNSGDAGVASPGSPNIAAFKRKPLPGHDHNNVLLGAGAGAVAGAAGMTAYRHHHNKNEEDRHALRDGGPSGVYSGDKWHGAHPAFRHSEQDHAYHNGRPMGNSDNMTQSSGLRNNGTGNMAVASQGKYGRHSLDNHGTEHPSMRQNRSEGNDDTVVAAQSMHDRHSMGNRNREHPSMHQNRGIGNDDMAVASLGGRDRHSMGNNGTEHQNIGIDNNNGINNQGIETGGGDAAHPDADRPPTPFGLAAFSGPTDHSHERRQRASTLPDSRTADDPRGGYHNTPPGDYPYQHTAANPTHTQRRSLQGRPSDGGLNGPSGPSGSDPYVPYIPYMPSGPYDAALSTSRGSWPLSPGERHQTGPPRPPGQAAERFSGRDAPQAGDRYAGHNAPPTGDWHAPRAPAAAWGAVGRASPRRPPGAWAREESDSASSGVSGRSSGSSGLRNVGTGERRRESHPGLPSALEAGRPSPPSLRPSYQSSFDIPTPGADIPGAFPGVGNGNGHGNDHGFDGGYAQGELPARPGRRLRFSDRTEEWQFERGEGTASEGSAGVGKAR